MDIMMPKMDGLEATRIIKADNKTKHIPVIALTSYAMKGDGRKPSKQDVTGILPNPSTFKKF